ncbi:MAG: glutathione S-transferase [Rhodobacteraceae bacterium]|nr:glutathione S-transferase [Paracoccaceae bacterium]
MKLIHSPASPFVRKVLLTLHETGMSDRVELVNVATTALATAPEAKAANPLGKIPALIRDDGRALHDSAVICRYIDSLAGAGLYPSNDFDAMTLESMADGIMDAGVLMVYEARLRPAEKQFEPWVEAQWGKICGALDHIEAHWMGHLDGNVTGAQIALGAALGYLDFRHDARGWRKGHGKLDDWFAAFSQRPSMKATQPA